jgi:hypothetical protein
MISSVFQNSIFPFREDGIYGRFAIIDNGDRDPL